MIPVEYLWLALTAVFAFVGAVRGIMKELGVSTILLLSLFALKFTWEQLGSKILQALQGRVPFEATTVQAIYYGVTILFVAYISYEGIVLQFPLKKQLGLLKGLFGFFGGLLNGYLIVGTIWDVVNQAKYFGVSVPFGTAGSTVEIGGTLTSLHNTIAQYLPVTFINPFIMLVIGMILLLAIVLK